MKIKEFFKNNFITIAIIVVFLIAVIYLFARKKNNSALNNNVVPATVPTTDATATVSTPAPVINKTLEKNVMARVLSVLSDLEKQFNKAGCVPYNENNSNASISELKDQRDLVQDANIKKSVALVVDSYPKWINDCGTNGWSAKGNLINQLRFEVTNYNNTLG